MPTRDMLLCRCHIPDPIMIPTCSFLWSFEFWFCRLKEIGVKEFWKRKNVSEWGKSAGTEPNYSISNELLWSFIPEFFRRDRRKRFFCKRIEARVRFHEKPTFGKKESLGKCGNSGKCSALQLAKSSNLSKLKMPDLALKCRNRNFTVTLFFIFGATGKFKLTIFSSLRQRDPFSKYLVSFAIYMVLTYLGNHF